MTSKPSFPRFALALLATACLLLSMACVTPPSTPPAPAPVPIAWPVLPPPPATGIELAPDGRVLVPLDYWTDLAAYVLAVDKVRASLARQGMILQ